jgi:polyhydroxyalkanoate synthesis regulator phasin
MGNWITSEEKIFILDRMVTELNERVDALEQQVIALTALKKQQE